MAMMNKEEIFFFISKLAFLSDELNNFMREMDIKISEAEVTLPSEKVSASMLSLILKQKTAPFKADKEWADRQISLLRDLRIAALSAQRSAE